MKLKLLGFVFAVALILVFIDVGLVPILVNRHDESRTDVVYRYQYSEKKETADYSALANAIQGFLMGERGLTNVSWWFSATRHYSNEESWSSWIPLENYSSYISSLNYTPCRVEFSQGGSGAFRVSSVSRVYLYTEITMTFFSSHAVAVENDAWLWASLFFNAFMIASTVIFYVQNSKIMESE